MTTKPDNDKPDGPARVTALHVQDRNLGIGASAKKGYRNIGEHPLTLAYEKGQLIRGRPQYTARMRFDAGEQYRELSELKYRSGRDSTDLDVVSGGSAGLPLSQAQSDAIRKIISIDSHLSPADRQIVRAVCGEGQWPSVAVASVLGATNYRFAAVPRFCEALDSLIEAIDTARKSGWKFTLRNPELESFPNPMTETEAKMRADRAVKLATYKPER